MNPSLSLPTHDVAFATNIEDRILRGARPEAAYPIVIRASEMDLDTYHEYENVLTKTQEHLRLHDELRLFLHISAVNSYTVKFLFGIFKLMNEKQRTGAKIKVVWFISERGSRIVEIADDLGKLFQINVLTIAP